MTWQAMQFPSVLVNAIYRPAAMSAAVGAARAASGTSEQSAARARIRNSCFTQPPFPVIRLCAEYLSRYARGNRGVQSLIH